MKPLPYTLQQNETAPSIVRKGDSVSPVKITWQGHPNLAQNFTTGAIKTSADAIAPIDTAMKPLPYTLQQNETATSIVRKMDAGAPVMIDWQAHPNLAQNESRNSTVTAAGTAVPIKVDWKPHP